MMRDQLNIQLKNRKSLKGLQEDPGIQITNPSGSPEGPENVEPVLDNLNGC